MVIIGKVMLKNIIEQTKVKGAELNAMMLTGHC